MTDQPTFNPAYRVARCGDSSSHGPHVVDHGPDQPRNCPGSGNEWRWEPDSKGGWVSAPRCCEPTCPDFGDWDFGEGTCPAEHSPARAPETGLRSTLAAEQGPARGNGCAGPSRAISRGQKPCGCGWTMLASGVIRWHTRCAEHAEMCRGMEDWEMELLDQHGLTRAEDHPLSETYPGSGI